MKLMGSMLLALLGVVAAFAVVFGLGWAIVHFVGPFLFFVLPPSVAYVVTAIVSAGALYWILIGRGDARRRRDRLAKLAEAPRETADR